MCWIGPGSRLWFLPAEMYQQRARGALRARWSASHELAKDYLPHPYKGVWPFSPFDRAGGSEKVRDWPKVTQHSFHLLINTPRALRAYCPFVFRTGRALFKLSKLFI